jgi:hypothetical protein
VCIAQRPPPCENGPVETRDFFARAELLNLPQLKRDRPDWTDRLPPLFERPSPATNDLVKRHWSFLVPTPVKESYDIWRIRRRHQRNLEQIEIDELDEVASDENVDDGAKAWTEIHTRHEQRRIASRFLVATRERRRLERLAGRWDVDCPPMIERGQADEAAITKVRRAVRDARWTFIERCAKTLVPVLSLLVALAALLTR